MGFANGATGSDELARMKELAVEVKMVYLVVAKGGVGGEVLVERMGSLVFYGEKRLKKVVWRCCCCWKRRRRWRRKK